MRTKFILLPFFLLAFSFLPLAAARAYEASLDGYLIVDQGTVYLVTAGFRRPFRSPEVFFSHGYKFSDASPAGAADLALPVGPVMIFRDGALVKGPSSPLVYLVAGEKRRGFTSAEAFLGLGYSFVNVVTANVETFADLIEGPVIGSSAAAHPAGTLVNDNGAVYLITASGKRVFTSASDFFSYGYDFKLVVKVNEFDRLLTSEAAMSARNQTRPAAGSPPPASPSPVRGPQITGVAPNPVEVGKQVTVSGTGFSMTNNLVQLGNILIGVGLSSSGTSLTFKVPDTACAAGLSCFLKVIISTPAGTNAKDYFLEVKGTATAPKGPAPALSRISPSSATAGETIRIYGTGLASSNTVWLGEKSLSVTPVEGVLVFNLPSNLCAAGISCRLVVKVENDNGTSNNLLFDAIGPNANY